VDNQIQLLESVLGYLKAQQERDDVNSGGKQSSEDKNILQGNTPSDPNNMVRPKLRSNEIRRTNEVASLFAKTFFEYEKKNKKDTAPKTSIQKISPLKQERKVDKNGSKDKKGFPWKLLLGGLGLLGLLGGVGALITGLLTDGPFKGALKILGKLGIKGGIKLLMSGARGLLKGLWSLVKLPFKLVGKIFGKMGGKSISKIFAKLTGGTMFKMAAKFLKPLLMVIRKVPLLGNLISIGFAVSRFMDGDITAGVIDLISAASGLLYLVPGGQAIAPIIMWGADILNAWLDYSASKPENKGKSKLNILGDMVKSIGKWIWDHGLYLPLIGGFKRWGMSYEAFKSGNILDGVNQFGAGLLTFIGSGGIVKGVEMLMGLMGGEKKEDGVLAPITDFFGSIGKWIWDHGLYLPVIGGFKRWGMAWESFKSGNILDGVNQFGAGLLTFIGGGGIVKGVEMLMGLMGGEKKEDGVLAPITDFFGSIGKWIWDHGLYLPVIGGFKRWGMAWESFKSGNFMDGLANMGAGLLTFIGGGPIVKGVEMLMGLMGGMSDEGSLKPKKGFVKAIGDWIKSKLHKLPWALRKPLELLGILDDDGSDNGHASMSDSEKQSRSKRAGYNSWKEYKDSDWNWKSNKTLSDSEKQSRAKRAGYNSWKEYKDSDWNWKNKSGANGESPNVIISGNSKAPEILIDIGKQQVVLLSNLHKTTHAIFEQLKKGGMGGGGSSTQVVPVPSSPQPRDKNDNINMTPTRNDYGGSVYAL